MERGINVVGHEFFGRDQAKLFYYPLAGDAPIASGSRDLPPPAGLPNPVPTHQSQPPISEQLRKLAESPQLAALLQSCKNDHIDPKVEAPCPASIDAIPSVSKRTNISQPPSKQPLSITPVSQPSPRLAPPTPRPLKSSPPGVQRPLPPPASSAAPKPQAPVITSSRPSAAPVCKPEPSDIIDLTLSSAPPKPAVSVLVSSRPPAAPRSKPEPSDTIDLTLSSDDIPKHEPEPEVIPSSLPEDYEEDELAGDVTPPPPEPSSAGKQRAPVQTTDCLLVASGTLTLDSQYGMKIKAGAAKSLLRSRQPGPSERTPSPQDMSRSPSPEPSEPIGGMSAGDHGTHAGRDSSGMSDQGAHANDSIDETAQLRAVEWTQRGEVTIRAAFNNYDKPRRLLTGSARGLVTVSMRGAVDLVTWKSKKRTTLVRPSERSGELVDDACMLRTTDDKTYTLLAHTRNRNQLSLLRVRTSGEPVAPVLLTRPSERGSTNAGASVVCAMLQPGAFATGGYDHKVHLWNAPGDVTQATARELPLRHSACVHALLPVRDTSHKLLSAGADCRVGVYELASERVVHAFKVSNAVYHLHDAGLPYCALFEVAHRELQFEMRDYRMVPERPVQRFGFNMEVLQGRHAKGDIKDFYFACGDREGNVRLWDIRKADKPVSIVNCFPGHRTVQVAFRGQELVVCSDDFQVKFLGPASD
ncbi:WD40 repeat-like protein [Phanerochaete sordida]|uniref:WD40 repeat-like protein n=1 Tax=Phanerochaete sordida TaxID=48140 RepID=A0A9P3FY18_9APHY|nr:WD40 repeat-like protein [Phanerochaete sordida]